MPADRIIRDAARGVLDADQPVRVFDGDEMVGVVDDEAILRVVVAEDEHSRRAPPTAPPPRPTGRRRRPRSSARVEPARAAPPGADCWALLVVWCSALGVLPGHGDPEIGGADLTGFHRWLNGIRDGFGGPGQLLLRVHHRRHQRGDRRTVDRACASCSASRLPAAGTGDRWLGVVAVFSWLAYALAGLRSAVMVLVGLLLFGFLGYWQTASTC